MTGVRRVLVAGGAGFVGSHVCDHLVGRGDEVVAVDNLVTGRRRNIAHLEGHDRFSFVEADVCDAAAVAALPGRFHAVMNLASPASPRDFATLALEILEVGSTGTRNLLERALADRSRFLQASTSEVYGDPLVHPQPETYWGNVNPVGPRSCYDEAKRFGEALTVAYRRFRGVDTTIARIFNTYGPRMRPDDGRSVTNFVTQALAGTPLTVYGDGTQTRSFCYVTDEAAGLVTLLDSDAAGPVNVGNPTEHTLGDLARLVIELAGSASPISHHPLPEDDPLQRRPDIARIRALGWEPSTPLETGLRHMIDHVRAELSASG
jgi:dTDP-glucose 4,6-dehydratase